MNKEEIFWDVVVIGGGPAGMMAAGRAAELDKRVIILEKNDSLGKKLLISGGGRCNLTNAEPDQRVLLSRFKEAQPFLFSPFSKWNNFDSISFFNTRNMPTKVENEGRVFPASDKARSVWDVLVHYLAEGKVTISSNSPVSKVLKEGHTISGVQLQDGIVIRGHSYIIATGGKSRPDTGSTGDAFSWLRDLGHAIIEPNPSLVPVAIEDQWVKELQGVTLPEVKISTIQYGQKQNSKVGRLLFTHFGVSGPTILNMSKSIGELLSYEDVEISLDLFPGKGLDFMNAHLLELFQSESNKKVKNVLGTIIVPALAPAVLEKSGIDPDTPCHSITRESRITLIGILKDMRMRVSHLLGADKAIVTSGGISLEEVNWKTMQSTLHPNLFIVGDMLNIDRPSGGYGLQLCWTTGYVAGTASATLDSESKQD